MNRFEIIQGNITKSDVDAIVNAANIASMKDGAILLNLAPGPRWRDGQHGEPELLANCYRNSLRLASENDCHTVDFPSISTGVYRFPLDQAAQIAVREITRYLADHPEMERVRMVCFDSRTYAAYAAALAAQECAG